MLDDDTFYNYVKPRLNSQWTQEAMNITNLSSVYDSINNADPVVVLRCRLLEWIEKHIEEEERSFFI